MASRRTHRRVDHVTPALSAAHRDALRLPERRSALPIRYLNRHAQPDGKRAHGALCRDSCDGRCRARTSDPLLVRQVLSQLS